MLNPFGGIFLADGSASLAFGSTASKPAIFSGASVPATSGAFPRPTSNEGDTSVTPDAAGDRVLVKSGQYAVKLCASGRIDGAGGSVFRFTLRVDGVEQSRPVGAKISPPVGADGFGFSMVGIYDIPIVTRGDAVSREISLYGEKVSGSDQLIFTFVQLVVIRLG